MEPPGPGRRALEDEWIVVRCQLGERAAFDELIARWDGPIRRYALRLTGDEESARDATQDVWLKVLRGIPRLRDGSRLRAWLFGIARRTLMDRLRERYAAPPVAGVDPGEIADEELPDDREEDLAAMREELGRLPVVEREALTLFYLRELSLVEVAEVLGVPVGTVKSRLFRARRFLRDEIESSRRRS